MGRLTHIAVCAVLLCASGVMAHAQSAASLFPTLWQSYLTVCGTAIADPVNVNTRLTTLSPLPQKTFAQSTTGNVVMLEQMDNTTFETAYLQVFTLAQGHWVECEVGRELGTFGNGAQLATEVQAMLAASGQMNVIFGDMQPLPQSTMLLSELHEVPWYTLTVEGAFPGRPIITLVDIDPSGLNIRMAGRLP